MFRALLSRTSVAMLTLGLAGFATGVFLGSCTSSGVTCTAGLSRCGIGCADFKSDVHNCGACNLSCQTHQICQSGQCVCQPGTVLCGGSCVLPSSDPQNCGGCAGTDGGIACSAAQVCEGGQCKSQCTLPGLTACARACVDLSLDPDNCGNCGNACGMDGGVDGGPLLCDNGQCRATCTGDGLACNRSCINRLTDSNNCGGCGNVCDNARSCHGGICVYDMVAACFNTGQVVGIQSRTDLIGPLSAIGTSPQALGVGQNVLLVADGTDRQLRQARLSDLSALPGMTALGASPNHILVDSAYVYVVNSLGNTLQILRADGGTAPDGGLALATISELNFDAGASPQAIAKVGTDLYIPLQGGPSDVSASGLARVDVSNPASPVRRETIGFGGIDLRSFDGGRTDPRPSGIAVRGGQLYVSLSNLNPGFGPPGGPGVLAKVNRDAGVITPIYLPDGCLDAYWVASAGEFVFVSCGGKVSYDQPPPFPVEKSGLVVVNNADQPIAIWSASCAGAPACAPPSVGRFTIAGDRLYVGDTSGRVFVLQLDGGQLIERRGYVNGGLPLTPCPPSSMGFSLVQDIISVP